MLPQVLHVVEDILYAPSQEEGERILGEAMAGMEAQPLATTEHVAGVAAGRVQGQQELMAAVEAEEPSD